MQILWMMAVGAISALVAKGLCYLFLKNKHLKLQLIIMGVLVATSVNVARTLPNPLTSREDRGVEELVVKLEQIPEYNAKFKDVTDETVAKTMGAELSSKGLKRLDDDTLMKHQAIIEKFMAMADEPSCAALTTGDQIKGDIMGLVKKLDDQDFEDYMDIAYKATEAELKGTPTKTVDEATTNAAYDKLKGVIPADDMAKIVTITNKGAQATDADNCWLGKTLYANYAKLDKPTQLTLIRVGLGQ